MVKWVRGNDRTSIMIFGQMSSLRRSGTVLAAFCIMIPAADADTPPTEWQITKCRVYSETLKRLIQEGREEFSVSFLDENAAFVEKGCTERMPVCPRTQADLDAANILTIAAMNAGAASTFLPFDCVRR